MKRSLILLAVLAGCILALDMWTKQWAERTLAYHAPVELLGEFVRLTYTRNSGVAFGLGAGVRFPYYLFSIIAIAVILYLFVRRRAQSRLRQVALSLILGGALGNLVDRLKTGEVVDFIEIGWRGWHWPVFNVADAAVTIGVVLFAFAWTRHGERPAAPAGAPEPAPERSDADLGLRANLDDSNAGSLGAGSGQRGAPRPLPGGGTDRPLP